MTLPAYYVRSSISADDMATFEDRETGSQDVAVKVTQENDGTPDAKHATTLTIDLDIAEGVYAVININGHPYIEMQVL